LPIQPPCFSPVSFSKIKPEYSHTLKQLQADAAVLLIPKHRLSETHLTAAVLRIYFHTLLW
jgi:hypothetical protein